MITARVLLVALVVFSMMQNVDALTLTAASNPDTPAYGISAGGMDVTQDGTYVAAATSANPFLTIYKNAGGTLRKLAGQPDTIPTSAALGASFTADGVYLALAVTSSPFLLLYKRTGDSFVQLAAPASLPTSKGNGVSFSYDGTYLGVAEASTPFVVIYKRSGDVFTKLANPAALPAGVGQGSAFSSDGAYLAIAHQTTPFVTIYKNNADTFTKLANPDVLPSSDGVTVDWSLGNTYLALGAASTPFLMVFKNNADTFTKLTDPTQDTQRINVVRFSHGTQLLFAGGNTGAAHSRMYSRSGDSFSVVTQTETLSNSQFDGAQWVLDDSAFITKQLRSGVVRYSSTAGVLTANSNPDIPPSGVGSDGTNSVLGLSGDGTYLSIPASTEGAIVYKLSGLTATKLAVLQAASAPQGTAFTDDGTYLAIVGSTNPFLTVYKRSGDTFSKLTDPNPAPTGSGNGVAWSHDGLTLAVAHSSTPFMTVYSRTGDTFTKLSNPSTLPPGTGHSAAVSSDGTYIAIAHTTTPFVTIYKNTAGALTKLVDPTILPAGTGNALSFSSTDNYLAVGHATTPFLTIYKRSADTFTKLSDPAILPAGTGRSVLFANSDTYLFVGSQAANFLVPYTFVNDVLAKEADPGILPGGLVPGLAFHADASNSLLAVTTNSAPTLMLYNAGAGIVTASSCVSGSPATNMANLVLPILVLGACISFVIGGLAWLVRGKKGVVALPLVAFPAMAIISAPVRAGTTCLTTTDSTPLINSASIMIAALPVLAFFIIILFAQRLVPRSGRK